MGKISTQDLAGVLVERWHIGKKEASQFVNELFFLIQKSLNEDKIVKVKGLGTFKIIDVDDRESVNVNTGDRVLIEGHGKITFTPDPLMKELVNKPFSQFETVVLKDGIDFNEAEDANQPEVTDVPDDTDDNAAPLVEFVTEDEPEVPEISEKPAKSENSQKSEPSEKSEKVAFSEPVAEEAPSKETEAVNEKAVVNGSEAVKEKEPSDENVSSDEDVAAEENAATDDNAASEEEEPTVLVEEEESAFKKYWKWIGIAVLTLAVGILIGYLMGNRSNAPQAPVQPSVEVADSEAVKALPNDSDAIAADSTDVEEEALAEEDAEEEEEEVEEEVEEAPQKEVAQPEKAPEAKPEERQLDKWEAMDARVKTGAYRIIGTDTVLKAKAGDDVARICKRTIGPGMECYLEVYNGISSGTALKAGQEIKIPKLELKKKKKK